MKQLRQCKKQRYPKKRGWKNKRRIELAVSDITADGFHLCTFNKDYYISRDVFAWFLGAGHLEIQDVVLFPCGCDDPSNCCCTDDHPGDHFRWNRLDVDLCTADFEQPETRNIYQASGAYRERYYTQCNGR